VGHGNNGIRTNWRIQSQAADKVGIMGGKIINSHRSIVATLLYIEAAIVLALGLWLIFFSFTHENEELAPLLGEISFAALGAIGLFAAGRGYARGKNYGRSPAILANLIALGVAYYQIQGAFYIGAVIILALALPTLYFAFVIAKNEG
jgi:hypothetical protein